MSFYYSQRRKKRLQRLAANSLSAPVNTSLPSHDYVAPLTPIIGTEITGVAGEWTNADSVAHQWQKSADGETWTDISGATSLNYTPTDADGVFGYVLRRVETATGPGGVAEKESTATAAVYYTYHVDSVNGSDANDGSTPELAFATLGAVPALSAGQSVGLARGSYWEETLAPAANTIHIAAYGTGDRPIIDCSTALSAGGWTDSTGRADANTNVYSRTLALESAAIQHFVNVYEDGDNLTLVASAAACQAAAGSYFVSNHASATPTLYIHPTGSTNPASNGVEYRHSAREYAISAGSRSGITIRGIETRRNLNNNGSIYCGRNALVDDCMIADGGAHNLLLADGSTLENSEIARAYCNASTAMIVFYDVNPTSAGVTVSNCTFSNPVWDTNINAIFCHSDGTGNLGVLTVEDCTFTNINLCVDQDDVTASIARRNTVTNCKRFYRVTEAITHTLADNVVTSVISGQGVLAVETQVAGATINITNDVYDLDNPSNGGIFIAHSNTTLVLENVRVDQSGATSTSGCIFLQSGLTGLALTMNNSELISNAGQNIRGLTAPDTYVGDNNCFSLNGGINIRWGGSTYNTIGAWRTASGQDAASTVGGC